MNYIEPLFTDIAKKNHEKSINIDTLYFYFKKNLGYSNPKKMKAFAQTLKEFKYLAIISDGLFSINWKKLSEDYPANPEFKLMLASLKVDDNA